MMNVLKKYSGVLFFYLVIIGMVLLVNARFEALGTDNNVTYAMSEWLCNNFYAWIKLKVPANS